MSARRQDPVSCVLCRKKKLRCSRQHPCSNCVSRGVPCERERGLPNVDNASATGAYNNDPEILLRLQRLEDLLIRVDAKITPTASRTLGPADYSSTQQRTPSDSQRTPGADVEEAHNSDTRLLEKIGTSNNDIKLSSDLEYRFAHTSHIDHLSRQRWGLPTSVIYLPYKEQATAFLDVYQRHIEFLHHVTYSPHVYRTLNEVYEIVSSNGTPPPGSVALLLSIFASTAALKFAVGLADEIPDIRTTEAESLCTIWAKAALDCLDYSRRVGRTSMEDLQAMITTFFLMYNLEGFSSRSRSSMGMAISIAKELGLHRVDHSDSRQCYDNVADKVELEVKRRVWWHLAATDWQLSVSGGPTEGTYFVQPQHIATKLPRNIEEEDLETQDSDFERPLSVPTASSYLIQRVKLAEICRSISDTIPLGSSGADSARYEDIMMLDSRFAQFLDDLPPFFQFNPSANEFYKPLYAQRPSTRVQKYTVNMICQTRRCRLHQPYLVRGFTNPAYAHSRNVCLESARRVIAVKHEIDEQQSGATGLLALSGVHHHLFFACVAFVMDICFNKGNRDAAEEARRKAEVMDALQILEEAKDRSNVAKRFLESLMDVMWKHKVRLFDNAPTVPSSGSFAEPLRAAATYSDPAAMPLSSSSTNMLPPQPRMFEDNFNTMQLQPPEADFDEIWQSYIQHGEKLEVPDWNELFSDLQMQMN